MKALLWIGLAAAVALAISLGSPPMRGQKVEQRDNALSVHRDARAIYIRTTDGVGRQDCAIYLQRGYKTPLSEIPVGREVRIDLASFVANDTLRFVPGVEKAERVHVICHQPRYSSTVFGFQ
jgi:hypothetical protein